MTALNSKKRPDSDRVFALRRYLIGFLFILVFVLLDRTTVYLQVLPGISAWYPPIGIALALLLGMGPRYAPLYWLAGFYQRKSELPSAILQLHLLARELARLWHLYDPLHSLT